MSKVMTMTLHVLPDDQVETSTFLAKKGDTVTIEADGPCIVLLRHASAAPAIAAALQQVVTWDTEAGHDGSHPFACEPCQRIDLLRPLSRASA